MIWEELVEIKWDAVVIFFVSPWWIINDFGKLVIKSREIQTSKPYIFKKGLSFSNTFNFLTRLLKWSSWYISNCRVNWFMSQLTTNQIRIFFFCLVKQKNKYSLFLFKRPQHVIDFCRWLIKHNFLYKDVT